MLTFGKIVFAFWNKQIVTVVVPNKQQAINMFTTLTCHMLSNHWEIITSYQNFSIKNLQWCVRIFSQKSGQWRICQMTFISLSRIFSIIHSDCKRSPLYSTTAKIPSLWLVMYGLYIVNVVSNGYFFLVGLH